MGNDKVPAFRQDPDGSPAGRFSMGRLLRAFASASLTLPLMVPAESRAQDATAADRAGMEACLSSAADRKVQPEGCIGTIEASCKAGADPSAAAPAGCAAREHAFWDRLLNDSYKRLLQKGGADEDRQLRSKQREWLAWRDSQCGASSADAAGSPVGVACLSRETARRALDLTRMAEGGTAVAALETPVAPAASPSSANRVQPAPPAAAAAPQASPAAPPPDPGVMLQKPPAWFLMGNYPNPAQQSAATVQQPAVSTAPQPVTPPPAPALQTVPGAQTGDAGTVAPLPLGQAELPVARTAPQAAPGELPLQQGTPLPAPEQQLANLPPAEAPPPPPPADNVSVIVENVETGSGSVVIALCDKGLSREGCPFHKIVAAKAGFVTGVFDDVPPGTYAVVAFHDANDNQDFDRSMGIPEEPYALSKDGGGKMIPEFQDAALPIGKGKTSITIRLKKFND